MRYSDEIKLSMSVDYKVNLGNYESASVFVCLSGVPIGATEEDIEYAMDTAGLAWEVIRDKVRAQAEGLKGKEEPPSAAAQVARQPRPTPVRPREHAVEAVAYSEDVKRALSAWARGIGMDREKWSLIQGKHGDACWHALNLAKDHGCTTLLQLMEDCIDGKRPSALEEYDPFKDDAVAQVAAVIDEVEVLSVFRLTPSELRKVQAAAKRMKIDLIEVANKTSNKEFAALMTSIDPDWKAGDKAEVAVPA